MVIHMQYEQVKELIELFEKTDLNDMEVHLGDAAIRLNRGPAQPQMPLVYPGMMPMMPQNVAAENTAVPVASAASTGNTVETKQEAVEPSASEENTKSVTAPIVGTFYQSSAPDQPPYVKVGDTIAAGDVVCIIEAMKFMNEVTSEVSGTVTEILVKDGQFVEFGQELFRVK